MFHDNSILEAAHVLATAIKRDNRFVTTGVSENSCDDEDHVGCDSSSIYVNISSSDISVGRFLKEGSDTGEQLQK
ncbi:hypothetical protein GCK32_019439 [Trichostrongylus colubriformis]|uniref:Uncharacterized protein n=1 Tax=Trichostrongylus colubriformis TaxID=6319 RepID=A0AAN8FJZ7_TRICO